MIKPRITIIGSKILLIDRCTGRIYPKWFWQCEGDGVVEIATTPYNAYRFWKRAMDDRSVPKKTKGFLIETYNRWFKNDNR